MAETRERLRELLQKIRQTGALAPEELTELLQAQDINMQTGPDVGEQVPDFTLPDAKGKPWRLSDLAGPQGLFLLFHRSVDW